ALEDAQIAALPFDGGLIVGWAQEASLIGVAQRFVDLAAGARLRTLVIVNHDVSDRLPLSGPVLVLRTSLDGRTRAPEEVALPAGHENIVDTHLGGPLPVREYKSKAVVSFGGLAARTDPPLKRRLKFATMRTLKKLGYYWPHSDGIYLRKLVLSHL